MTEKDQSLAPNNETEDSYENYREIVAKFPSVGICGHAIAKGDRIGWRPTSKKTVCSSCWTEWIEKDDCESADGYDYEYANGGAARMAEADKRGYEG